MNSELVKDLANGFFFIMLDILFSAFVDFWGINRPNFILFNLVSSKI